MVFQPGGGFASPHELRSYYLNHLEEFTNPVEISFRQIDVPPSRSNAAILEQVEKALKSGVPFVDVAKQVAEALGGDPGSAGRLIKKSFEELKRIGVHAGCSRAEIRQFVEFPTSDFLRICHSVLTFSYPVYRPD